jgi:general secretion pathway protein G
MRQQGFTLLELLFVLVIVALLAAIVGPSLTGGIDRARESALKEDLFVMRKAIDDYYADNGKYPPSLEILVEKRYLRSIPVDPITERFETWVLLRNGYSGTDNGIVNIKSGSDLQARDGSSYKDW